MAVIILINLAIPNTYLKSINLSKNTALKNLSLSNTALTSLDLSKNTELECLEMYANYSLKDLDLSQNTKLNKASFMQVYIESLNISNNLELDNLFLEETKLKSLDVSKSALGSLNLTNNTELEVLNTQYAGLSYINLDNNTKLNKFSLEQGWYKQNLQTPTLADKTYTLDLKPILGDANYANILFMDSRVKYDANLGVLTFTDASILNTDITYQYQTGHPNIIMNITLHIYK